MRGLFVSIHSRLIKFHDMTRWCYCRAVPSTNGICEPDISHSTMTNVENNSARKNVRTCTGLNCAASLYSLYRL